MPPRRREWFNEAEADRAVQFFERVLRLGDGLWAGQPFVLEPWQRDEIIRPLFGWMRWDDQWQMWVRKFSKFWIELPRGNGKTPIGAGILLQGLVADGEDGAEVYGAAEDREQGSIVWRDISRMVSQSPILRRRLLVRESVKRIIDPSTGSFYRVLPRDRMGDGSVAQGFRVHRALVDEAHLQRSFGLLNGLKKGMGKRVQPMVGCITTAGSDPNSPAGVEHAYAEKILADPELDPSYFVYMRNLPSEADPWDEANWHKVNPALGRFLSINTLREEAREAKGKPGEENDFRRYRLNQWVKQEQRRIPLHAWDLGSGDLLSELEERVKGRQCWGGIDLASTQDVNALVWDFPVEGEPEGQADDTTHEAVYRFWIPEERVAAFDKRTGDQASQWIRDGYLRTTPGNVTSYHAITEVILADGKLFDIQELGYDPWNAGSLVEDLEDAPFELVEIRQTMDQVAEPTKAWERLIFLGKYRHAGNPVMRWMVDNIAASEDGNGNWKIDKRKSFEKVDGPTAAVMALKLARLGRTAGESQAAGFW